MNDSEKYPQAQSGLDAASDILDHQLVTSDDLLVGKADDIELTERDGNLYVSAIWSGPGALGDRLNGKFGGWVKAIWSRLHPAEHPHPRSIPWHYVAEIDNAVRLNVTRELFPDPALELWIKGNVIDKIPGSENNGS